MDDWQYPRKSERAREGARERDGGSETDKEIERESIYLLHTSSGYRSNVTGPYTVP